MDRLDIYDPQEPWASLHREVFDTLPQAMRLAIQHNQARIQTLIEAAVEEEFGKEALKDLRPTSGFRSYRGNKKAGGKPNSDHLLGCARDFAAVGVFRDQFVFSLSGCYKVIKSKNCWHVSIIGG
jgi:hypothetical protein